MNEEFGKRERKEVRNILHELSIPDKFIRKEEIDELIKNCLKEKVTIVQEQELRFIIGLGLCTIGGAMLFAYFRDRDDDDSVDEREKKIMGTKKPEILKIEMEIPSQDILLIAGRSGAKKSINL
uniref:Uncharacterized protein n=1 Tax=Glossina pallidipes TaxID=7398 RepID=A0A1B0ABT8_GLOPL